MQALNLNQPGPRHDPHWHRTAVFTEALVRAFGDSKGSGSGNVFWFCLRGESARG